MDKKNNNKLPDKFNHYDIFSSFGYAFTGVIYNFKRELNLSIQLCIGLVFTLLGIFSGHWILAMANLILMGLTMSLEMLNTAFENLCDLVEPKLNPKVKVIKDTSAGAVLIISAIWLVVIIYQILVIFVVKDNPRFFTL